VVTTDYRELQLDKCVIALGKFQGLHLGHMLLIEETVRLSRKHNIPAVVFSINMNREKLINLQEERESILTSKNVDYKADCEFTKKFAGMWPEVFVEDILVKQLGAKYVVVGEDFCFGAGRTGNVEMLRSLGKKYGFKVIAFSKLAVNGHIISTSEIRKLLENGNVLSAGALMGRFYSITGTVQHGKELGRTIGFPTANIIPDEKKLLPKTGVYKTEIEIDGKSYTAITNVGDNPTVDGKHGIFVESNIIGFDGNIYGKKITVNFLEFIREQKKFANVEELAKQLEIDRQSVV
jgi:riboflavin kinase/FMN adenylyltransferase